MTHARPDWKDLARELGVDKPGTGSALEAEIAYRKLRPTLDARDQWILDQMDKTRPEEIRQMRSSMRLLAIAMAYALVALIAVVVAL